MAAGVPVVTSDCSALREVAGDAARLVNPHDIDALREALRELTLDSDLRKELALRGMERARTFTWEKAVRETWDVYQKYLC
jgi:glycosyltransferase involved in cell wall biosynthesis